MITDYERERVRAHISTLELRLAQCASELRQTREDARTARVAALEEAARLAETYRDAWDRSGVARVIRALASSPNATRDTEKDDE